MISVIFFFSVMGYSLGMNWERESEAGIKVVGCIKRPSPQEDTGGCLKIIQFRF